MGLHRSVGYHYPNTEGVFRVPFKSIRSLEVVNLMGVRLFEIEKVSSIAVFFISEADH